MPITLYKNLDRSQPKQFSNMRAVELWIKDHTTDTDMEADGLAHFAEQPDGEWLPVFNLVRIESDGAWEISFHDTASTEAEQMSFDTKEEAIAEFMENLQFEWMPDDEDDGPYLASGVSPSDTTRW